MCVYEIEEELSSKTSIEVERQNLFLFSRPQFYLYRLLILVHLWNISQAPPIAFFCILLIGFHQKQEVAYIPFTGSIWKSHLFTLLCYRAVTAVSFYFVFVHSSEFWLSMKLTEQELKRRERIKPDIYRFKPSMYWAHSLKKTITEFSCLVSWILPAELLDTKLPYCNMM